MGKAEYTKLLAEHRDRIYSLALNNLRNSDDAADITQETFLRLWRHEGPMNDRQARAWLLRVCHNLCIDHVRRRQTVRTYFGTPDSDAVDCLPAARNTSHNPESRLEQDRRRQLLLRGMASLPTETRSIMVLHYFQHMKIQEIADSLGIKSGTIKVRLHRARQTLRKILSPEIDDDLAFNQETG